MDVRSRGWCFTLNNPGLGHAYNAIKCQYLVVGDEVGASGTPHHQGYVYFAAQRSFAVVKKLLPEGAHIEKAHGSPQQAAAYCKKEKILIETGECPTQGKRKDIEIVRDMIADHRSLREITEEVSSYQAIRGAELLMKYHERKRDWLPEVYWFYGPTGSGKTRTAFAAANDPWVSGRDLRWWEGYDAHEDVILDDFRGDFCPFHELLRILDRYPYRIEVKGSSRQLLAKRIWITSPFPPERAYPNCGERIEQLIRRITEIRQFYSEDLLRSPGVILALDSSETGGKNGDTTVPDSDLEEILMELT